MARKVADWRIQKGERRMSILRLRRGVLSLSYVDWDKEDFPESEVRRFGGIRFLELRLWVRPRRARYIGQLFHGWAHCVVRLQVFRGYAVAWVLPKEAVRTV